MNRKNYETIIDKTIIGGRNKMGELNYTPLLSQEGPPKQKSQVKWFIGIICLAFVSLCTGSVNLFPSLIDHFENTLGFSHSLATVMLTGGTTIMYITLPAGLFMDKFGDDKTVLTSTGLVTISYIVLFFVPKNNIVFLIFYWLMAFGCSSLFIACLQVALSRNNSVKGVSTSIVSSSLSLAFGLLYKVYNLGSKIFTNSSKLIAGIKIIAVTVVAIIVILGFIARLCYTKYQEPPQTGEVAQFSKKTVLMDWRLFLLLFTMMFTVFDGMLVVAAGSYVWKVFDPTYEDATETWSFYFSIINCVFTIGLSALLDYVKDKFASTRTKTFSVFWFVMCIIPLSIAIALNSCHSRIMFGILMSCMSIPFGFGLTQVPAMTSDVFGNNQYGFAFGIVQFGSIVSALSTMPMMQHLAKKGTTVIFIITMFAHVITSALWFFAKKSASNDSKQMGSDLLTSP